MVTGKGSNGTWLDKGEFPAHAGKFETMADDEVDIFKFSKTTKLKSNFDLRGPPRGRVPPPPSSAPDSDQSGESDDEGDTSHRRRRFCTSLLEAILGVEGKGELIAVLLSFSGVAQLVPVARKDQWQPLCFTPQEELMLTKLRLFCQPKSEKERAIP